MKFGKLPADAVEIPPSNSSGTERKNRLFIVGENAHLLAPVAQPETPETDLPAFIRRKPKEALAVSPPAEVNADSIPELIERPKISEEVRETWREDAQALRADPQAAAQPAVEHRSGFIVDTNITKQYFFVVDSLTGERVFCHHSECSKPNNHFCVYKVGEAVLFDVKYADTRGLNVRLATVPFLSETEPAVISEWDFVRHRGFASRNCGCQIHVTGTESISRLIEVGSEIEYCIRERNGRYDGIGIHIIQEPPQTLFGQALQTALKGETCQ